MRLTVGEDTRAFASGNLAALARRTSEKRDWVRKADRYGRTRRNRTTVWRSK